MKYPIRDSNPYPIREDEGESLFNVPPIPRANCSTRRASCSDNGDIGCHFLQVVDTTTAYSAGDSYPSDEAATPPHFLLCGQNWNIYFSLPESGIVLLVALQDKNWRPGQDLNLHPFIRHFRASTYTHLGPGAVPSLLNVLCHCQTS